MEVGLDPGDIVLDGDPATPQKGAQQPRPLLAHVYCSQTVARLSNCLALVYLWLVVKLLVLCRTKHFFSFSFHKIKQQE